MSISAYSEDGPTGPVSALNCSESFWEIGNFKKTVKRIDDGLHLCHDLVSMIKERGELEAAHAKHLKQWSKKWEDNITKGPEYGTIQAAWLANLNEADKKADMHLRMRDRLEEEVQKTIKLWSKDQYQKHTFGGLKQSKEIDEAFKKAQKPWAKLFLKADKAKKDYYACCRVERSVINQEKNAQADTSISADQTKKLSEKVEKCAEESQRSREVFQKSLEEINAYNAKYMEDMCQVFERCQEMERKRLKFFRDILLNVHECLDMSNELKLKLIYDEFRKTIDLADDNHDLKWWEQNNGTGMPMNWPQFEEYTPELRSIYKESKKRDPITLIATKSVSSNADHPVQRQVSDPKHRDSVHSLRNGTTPQTKSVNGGFAAPLPPPPAPTSKENGLHPEMGGACGDDEHQGDRDDKRHSSVPGEPNPFEDDWDTTPPPKAPENGLHEQPISKAHLKGKGASVTALYDYVGQEDDELSFLKGEILEKLEDEDDQGWCKGRKDGKIGLYPANYVENVSS